MKGNESQMTQLNWPIISEQTVSMDESAGLKMFPQGVHIRS